MSGQLRATCNNGQLFVTNGSIVFFVKNLSSRREKAIENFAAHETVRLLFSARMGDRNASQNIVLFQCSITLLRRREGRKCGPGG